MNAYSSFIWIAYAAITGGLFYIGWIQIKKMNDKPPSATVGPTRPIHTHRSNSGLQSDILIEGTGPGAKNFNMVTVHYTAWLTNGEKVDSSYDRGSALTFKLGTGTVIYGWDEALKGAKVGEKRKITVPPKFAYGKKGTKKIPPNATVIFEVELLKIDGS